MNPISFMLACIAICIFCVIKSRFRTPLNDPFLYPQKMECKLFFCAALKWRQPSSLPPSLHCLASVTHRREGGMRDRWGRGRGAGESGRQYSSPLLPNGKIRMTLTNQVGWCEGEIGCMCQTICAWQSCSVSARMQLSFVRPGPIVGGTNSVNVSSWLAASV